MDSEKYPRELTPREFEWIGWILPAERPGYSLYRESIRHMRVLGEGRRGNGEIILGAEGTEIDLDSPLPPVFAYGAIETDSGLISVTLREMVSDQISAEIVSHFSEEIPENFGEIRRWTYSAWEPGQPCPQCGSRVREVPMHPATHAEK